MKILQISNRVPWPLNEGGTIGIYNFTRAFSEAGHEVSLYCLDGFKHKTRIQEARTALLKFCTDLHIHQIDTDFKWEEALRALLRRESYNVSRFESESFNQSIAELLSNKQFDVIQLEGTFAGPTMDTVRQFHKGLIVLRMHNVEYEIWSRLAKNSTNPVKSIYFRMLSRSLKLYEKRLLAKADIVSCVSPDDIQKFKLLSSKPVYYLAPAGVNLRYWEFHPSYSYFKWYHLGSLEWQANKEAVTWFLDEIFPQLYADFGISFHLGGKGINPSDYMSHNISINSRIEEANQFVYPLDVCVVPLLSGSGIRLKILEAMAAGKLVISTKVGAQGIDAEHGKQLLLANNQSEFRALLKELHSGKYDLKWIINNARKLVEEKYSIAAVSSSLIKLYTKFQADHHRE